MKKLIILTAVLSLSACSTDGDEIIFNTTLGPLTEGQASSLPSDLRGDTDGPRYSSEDRKGANMESEDGTNN